MPLDGDEKQGFSRRGRSAKNKLTAFREFALAQHFVKLMAIVYVCCACGDTANEALFAIDAHAEFVAKVALAVLLREGRVDVL